MEDDTDENWLDDEIVNLGKDSGGIVVAFADMGLWNGRVNGAKIMGWKVNSIFNITCDYNEFYADRYDIRANLTHHDGTHHCLYRIAPSMEVAERLVDAVAYGGMTEAQFRRKTKSLRPAVAQVYGW
jgi:hypothetical protein